MINIYYSLRLPDIVVMHVIALGEQCEGLCEIRFDRWFFHCLRRSRLQSFGWLMFPMFHIQR